MQITRIRIGVGARILLVSSFIVAVFTISNIYTYFRISDMQDQYIKLIVQTEPILNEVKSIRNEVWVQNSAGSAYIVGWDMIYMQKFRASKAASNDIFDSLEKKLSGKSLAELENIKQAVDDFTKTLEKGMSARNTIGVNETMKSMAVAAEKISAIEELMEEFNSTITADMEDQIAQTASSIEFMKQLILGINILTFILAACFSIWLAKYISRPLNEVVRVMQRTAQGDLRTQQISYSNNDEIGDLIQAVNTMVNNLPKVIKQVLNAAHQLASASEQLNISVSQSVEASLQVAKNVNEVAGGALNQTQSIDKTVIIASDMAQAITHIADNAAVVSAKSEVAAHSAISGADAVAKANSQMTTIKNSVSKSTEFVQRLGQSSAQISEIIGVMSGIAEQTNLLALNAAIEAARAGVNGRGFAVVADEVRKLAEESNKSAHKIAAIIQEVEKDTALVIQTMQQGNTEASAGIAVIQETGKQFAAIVTLVSELSGQIQGISAAAGNLALASDKVVESVDDVKKIAGQTADNTHVISASAEQQSTSMQEISVASQALGKMAEELSRAVKSFQI